MKKLFIDPSQPEEHEVLQEPMVKEIIKEVIQPITLFQKIRNFLFWIFTGILILIVGIYCFRWIVYIAGNGDEFSFARNHPEFVKPMRELYESEHKKTDQVILDIFKR